MLADRLGGPLFEKVGRRLVLSETAQLALGYAQETFLLGSELEAAVREQTRQGRTMEFRAGVAYAVPTSIAFHLVKPALTIDRSLRIVCREWRLDRLLSELAVHTLDLVIADAPLPPTVSVKAFSHRQFAHCRLRGSQPELTRTQALPRVPERRTAADAGRGLGSSSRARVWGSPAPAPARSAKRHDEYR